MVERIPVNKSKGAPKPATQDDPEPESKRPPPLDIKNENTAQYAERVLEDPATSKIIADLEPGLKFDRHALDEVWEQQADLYHDVSDALAFAISRRDAGKKHLEYVEAQVEVEVRDSAPADKRVTKDDVLSRVRVHPRVIAANDDLLRLSHAVNRLSALKEAYSQRSYAIKGLSELWVANYYQDASAKGSQIDERDRRAAVYRQRRAEQSQ